MSDITNSNNNTTEGNTDPELRWVLEMLEKRSEFYPYVDEDFKILILEESEIPMMVMNREVFEELKRRIIGDI